MQRNRHQYNAPRAGRPTPRKGVSPDPRTPSHPSHPSEPSASTSWDPVARWYKRWTGRAGSEYHRKIAIPAVLDLLGAQPGETILDIGCGTGILTEYVTGLAAGIRYIGIDAGPKLLAVARRHHGALGTFIQADARSLPIAQHLQPAMADAAVFLLSIQDMDPLADVLSSAAWAVNDKGRIVILMLHPCFRVPRQSGWGWDTGRKLQFRRVDAYLSPLSVPVRPIGKGEPGSIKSFHLPLHEYVNGLSRNGFFVDRVVELPAYPDIRRSGPNSRAENRANREIPVFLGLRAVRRPGASP